MKVKQLVAGGVIAGSLGLLALGVGAGTASAQPSPFIPGGPGGPMPGIGAPGPFAPDGPGAPPPPVNGPFQYQGQMVHPAFNGAGWGFWLHNNWIPL